MERPAQRYFCSKCGYVGNVDLHPGCGYLAYHLAPFEQNYIDQLERELALLKASPASVPADVPYYKVVDRGFRWDSENQQHIPQLLIEFTPVPANAPNDSTGWKDRDTLATMLAAASSTSYHWKDCPDCRKSAPTPPVSEDRWLPIETAPKDGSEFVTCNTNQGGVKELVSWNIFHGFWQSKGASIHMQATYWMPLPKAPAMQEGKP